MFQLLKVELIYKWVIFYINNLNLQTKAVTEM